MARRKVGSANQAKVRRQVARAYGRERSYRKNFVEQTSHRLATTFVEIRFEDLKLQTMTKSSTGTVANPGTGVAAKTRLNHNLLRLGLGELVTRTQQKAITCGGSVLLVDPRFTSQTCSVCGHRDRRSRHSQAEFHCRKCDFRLNADTNAARNILAATTLRVAA